MRTCPSFLPAALLVTLLLSSDTQLTFPTQSLNSGKIRVFDVSYLTLIQLPPFNFVIPCSQLLGPSNESSFIGKETDGRVG